MSPLVLVVEIGAGLPNANTYGEVDQATTLAKMRQFGAMRGAVISADDNIALPLLVRATDYLESKARLYVGKQASVTQALSWPRKCVKLEDGSILASDVLPQALINALYQLCIEQTLGVTLQPSIDPQRDGGFITREKIDVIETSYSERLRTLSEPNMPSVDAFLAPLLFNTRAFGFGSIRV